MSEAGKARVPFEGDYSSLISGASGAVQSIGEKFLGVLGPLAGVTAAVAGIGLVAQHLAGEYDDVTAKMAAASAIPIAQAQAIGNAFLTTGGQSIYSAQQMMEAFGPVSGQLEQTSGHALDANESLTFMTAAMDAAQARGEALSGVTASLATIMQSYGEKVDQAAHVSDVLTNVSAALNLPIADLVSGFDKLHAKLGDAAPSIQDTGALLVIMADHGLSGGRAVMAVSAGLTHLEDGSKAVNGELEKLGAHVYDSSGKFVGMDSVIAQLQPKLSKMTEQQRNLALETLFGTGAAQSMGDVIMGGVGAFDAASAAVGKTGSAHAAAATATDTSAGAWDRLKGKVQNFLTQAGGPIDTFFKNVLNFLTDKVIPFLVTTLPTVVGNVVQFFKDHVIPVFTDISTAVGNVVQFFQEHVIPVLQTDVPKAFKALSDWYNQHLAPIFDAFGTVLRDVASVAIPMVIGAVGDLVPVFSGIETVLSHIAIVVIPMVWWAVSTLVTVIGDVLSGATNTVRWISDHWPELIPVFALVAAALLPTIVNFIAVETQAGISAVAAGASWVAGSVTALAGWATFQVQYGLLMAQEIIDTATNAATAAASWVAASVTTTAGWVTSAATTAASFVANAVSAGVQAGLTAGSWVASASTSTAGWVAAKLEIIGSFLATSAQAAIEAVTTSAAWEASGAASVAAWVTAKLAMMGSFLVTSTQAVIEAATSSAAWVGSAVASAASWVVTKVAMLAGWVATAAAAGVDALLTSGAWEAAATASTVAWAAAGVAIDAVMTGIGVAASVALGPVGLLIAAIAVATAGLVWLMQHNAGQVGEQGVLNPNFHPTSVQSHATGGTQAFGETAWFGEEGPELGTLTSAGMVYHTASQSHAMAQGGRPVQIVQYITISGTSEELLAKVDDAIGRHNAELVDAWRAA